jgi:hypothetical protein
MLGAQLLPVADVCSKIQGDGEHVCNDGLVSALVGIGANRSIESGLPVKIRELCPELKKATHFHEFD